MRAHARVHIRARPHSPRTPTEEDYEESPRPVAATGPHDPVTPTHAHSSVKTAGPPKDSGGSAGPTRSSGSCESGPGESPPSRAWSIGPARGRWRTAASGRRGGWMPHAAWEAMLADALQPLGVHPRNLSAPQDHPYVLRRLRETLQETQRDGIRLLGHHPKPSPAQTHPLTTPQASAHRHRRHPQHPRSPAHHTPRRASPSGQRRRHLTPLPSKPPPRGATPGPAQKSPNEPDAEGRQHTQQRAPLRPKARNPGPRPSQPPNRAKTQTQIKPEPHTETANP